MDDIAAPPALESKSPAPLLPAVLLAPAAFLWLWVLPIGVLLLLNAQAFWLIEGNLSAQQRNDALAFGVANLANLLIGAALYFIAAHRAKARASTFATQPGWGVPALLVQVGFLWWGFVGSERFLPGSVTIWIYPVQRHLFNQFAFAMLPLFLGLLRLAGARAPRNPVKALTLNLAAAVGAPILYYGLVVTLSSVRHFAQVPAAIFATGLIGSGILMFFGVVRGLLLGLRHLRQWGFAGRRAAILFFALLLPLCGLLLNRAIPFPVDFQAWEVYALVIANAAILLIAARQHGQRPRLTFHLLCVTFPFSLYFFIVFLPYTPLSILAVIVVGAGFLVLTPIFLFVLHLYALHQARRDLPPEASRWRLIGTGLLCSLLLPVFFTSRAVADKSALNAALDYVYAPSITTENSLYPASLANLRRALRSHRSYKNGIYYPLLSDFYSWVVFDNLVLPDDKLDRLEQTFFGSAGSRVNQDLFRQGLNPWNNERSVRDRTRMPRTRVTPQTASLRKLETKTTPTANGDAVTTFTLTLENEAAAPAEFVQKLPLPSGVFVNGFRLSANGQSMRGRIFEKKTALWVYTMIRDSERRDPGLLFYNTRDELELRVFPIDAHSPVTVEIDFLHPGVASDETFPLLPGDPVARLSAIGRAFRPQITHDALNGTAVSGLNAREFPAVPRETYLHLIVDRSADNAYVGDLSATFRTLQKKFPHARLGRVTLANYDVIDLAPKLLPLDELARILTPESLRNLPASGGLALDLCLAHAIRQHRDLDLDRAGASDGPPPVPVFVILSRKASSRTLDLSLTETWRDLLPALEIYELDGDGGLQVHRQQTHEGDVPVFRLGSAVRPLTARQAMRFPLTDEKTRLTYWSPSQSAWQPVPQAAPPAEATPWSRAVALQLQEQDHGRSPGAYRLDRKELVNASRASGILLPVTSYIAVENSAQWRMLELSERQKLEQNAALDFRETPAPPAVWLAAGLVLWFAFRRFRQRSPRGFSNQASTPAVSALN